MIRREVFLYFGLEVSGGLDRRQRLTQLKKIVFYYLFAHCFLSAWCVSSSGFPIQAACVCLSSRISLAGWPACSFCFFALSNLLVSIAAAFSGQGILVPSESSLPDLTFFFFHGYNHLSRIVENMNLMFYKMSRFPTVSLSQTSTLLLRSWAFSMSRYFPASPSLQREVYVCPLWGLGRGTNRVFTLSSISLVWEEGVKKKWSCL